MCMKVFWVMSAHIKQSVREQPDIGYWKSLLASFAAEPSWLMECADFIWMTDGSSAGYGGDSDYSVMAHTLAGSPVAPSIRG